MIPLEDLHVDVLAKARNGLELSETEVADRARVSPSDVAAVFSGDERGAAMTAVARTLGLGPTALASLAEGTWQPGEITLDGLAQFNTTFFDMTVNAYLVWDPKTLEAVAFDTGADASPMLRFADDRGLKIVLLLLTHTHGDHVADLAKVREKTGASAHVSSHEPCDGAEPFADDASFTVGALTIDTRRTWGHSPGGTTFVVHGLARPVAIVGDALFAGSMGGGKVSYPDALATNKAEIFTLPDDTILAPGHGPMTTVANEKLHNPFFAP
jgi:glyoxylase-like metal-dependent hydrolase (beta-lactamase superfamily II)